MRTKLFGTLVAFGFLAGLLSAGAARAADPIVLQSAGCKTEYFLLQELAAAYSAKTGTKLQLGNTGNKKAVELLMDKKIDFAFTCKTIGQLTKGLKLDPNAVGGWTSIPVAKDPIVVVTNSKNGVTSLTTAQLTEIFQGKITNWKEVGGSDLPIHTAYMNPDLESGVVLLFKEFTMGEEGILDDKARLGDNPSMLGNYVSMTPGGVTFMGFNSYQEKFGPIMAIDGVVPNRENILNGGYKLAATYYLTLHGGENKDVAAFLQFVRSEDGKAVIGKNFIPFSQ
jgi:phosphate transport system substrate-binding protein